MKHAWIRSIDLLFHAVMLVSLSATSANAQESERHGWQWLDLSVAHHRLSADYAPWQETAFRGVYRQGDHLWGMDVLDADRFSERGLYAGVQDTVQLAPDWRATLGGGMGENVNWLPRYRLDGFLHHTWGEARNWVTHLGLGEYKAHDVHRDRWGSIGMSAYMNHATWGPWVAQGEVRWTRSEPGPVTTRQQFVALTWGQHRSSQLTWRHGWGREGWQAIGDARLLQDFASRQDTLSWQHWIEPEWGIRLMAEHYRNDQYHRSGLTFGVFRDFP